MWGIDGPPKLHQFVWRACRDSVGLRERLQNRHVSSSSKCQLCAASSETILHALFKCTQANEIWRRSHFAALVPDDPTSSFVECFEWMLSKLSKDEVTTFCTLMWAAWFCRNKRTFDAEMVDPTVVASRFVKQVEEYRSYAKDVFRPRVPPNVVIGSWQLPDATNLVKANFHAHISPNGKKAWVGFSEIMRDKLWRWDRSVLLRSGMRVLQRLLQLGSRLNSPLDVDLVTSCWKVMLQFVCAIKKNEDGLSRFFRVVKDITHMARELCVFSIFHI